MKEVEQIFGPGGSIEAFEQAKKQGKCRFIGFTGHRDPKVHLEMLKRYDKYDTILMPLNPADPGLSCRLRRMSCRSRCSAAWASRA